VLGLELGADDYISKPSPPGAVARVRAILPPRHLHGGAVKGQMARLRPHHRGSRHALWPGWTGEALEFNRRNSSAGLFRQEPPCEPGEKILQQVWGLEYSGKRTIDAHVRRCGPSWGTQPIPSRPWWAWAPHGSSRASRSGASSLGKKIRLGIHTSGAH